MSKIIHIIIIVIFFNVACSNGKEDNVSAIEIESKDSFVIIYEEELEEKEITKPSKKSLTDIPIDNIIAELVYPKILIYNDFKESRARFSYGIRLYSDNSIIDTIFYEDNMTDINSISIDTLRFGKMKLPEIIIKFDTYGEHSYGGDGGWAIQNKHIHIWNGNTLDLLLELVTDKMEYHNTETGTDTIGEITDCITTSKLKINTELKELVRDSIISICNDTNIFHVSKKTYYFKENKFIERR